MIDFAALAAIAPAAATVFTTIGAVVLAWIARLRRKDELDARLAAKDHPALLDSITKSTPPDADKSTARLPVLLLLCGVGLTVQSGINAEMYADQYASEQKKKCPGGCPPGSTCNTRTGSCEAQAIGSVPVRPSRIEEPRIVRSPTHRHDARLMVPTHWDPLDCKLNNCNDDDEDEL